MAGVGAAAGPLIGGLITTAISWLLVRLRFGVNPFSSPLIPMRIASTSLTPLDGL
jgi:hypothetical protein